MKYKLKRIYKRNYIIEKALILYMVVLILGASMVMSFYAGRTYEIKRTETFEYKYYMLLEELGRE